MEPVFTFGYPPFQVLWWATVATLPGIFRKHAARQIGGGKDGGDDPVALIAAGSKHFSAQLPTPSALSDAEIHRAKPSRRTWPSRARTPLRRRERPRPRERTPSSRQVQVWKHATHSLPMQEAVPLDTLPYTFFWAATER